MIRDAKAHLITKSVLLFSLSYTLVTDFFSIEISYCYHPDVTITIHFNVARQTIPAV